MPIHDSIHPAFPDAACDVGARKTLLVVDDDAAVLTLLRRMLKRLDYDAVFSLSALEGLIIFRRKAALIDGALLDVSMPEMSGLTCLRELRAFNPRLPVLFSSGNGCDPELQQCLSRGEAMHLPKPYQPHALAAALANLFSVRAP